jgi:phage shock protein E
MIHTMKRVLVQVFLLALMFTSAVAGGGASLTDVFVIDVRTEAEWNAGHLESAILIPHDRIETGIAKKVVNKNARIYLYCRSGRRTAISADVLKRSGYLNIINLGTMENASKTLGKQIIK